MKPIMNVRRFLVYVLLACWIVLTVVTVGTAIQWSTAHAASEVKTQRSLAIFKEAMARIEENGQRALEAARKGIDLTAELERNNDRTVARVEAASQAMDDALNFEQVKRKHFWWEFALWVGLTLCGSALLARSRGGTVNSR